MKNKEVTVPKIFHNTPGRRLKERKYDCAIIKVSGKA
jgi:hypothetical protein